MKLTHLSTSTVLCVSLAFCGCKRGTDGSGSTSAASSEKLGQSPTPKASAIEDPNVVAFKDGMKKYIEEARSLARGMDLLLESPAYKKRVATVSEAYSRIPEPPANNKAYDTCYRAARQIVVSFEVGDIYLKFIDDFLRLNSTTEADKVVANYKELAAKQKTDLSELEAALNEGREPKIELSDVIKGKK